MTTQELMHNAIQWDLHRCKFPGSNVFNLLSTYDMTRKEIENLYDKLTKRDGWLTEYNVKHRFSSTQRVFDVTKPALYQVNSLKTLEEQLKDVLGLYYDKYTAQEWVEQHVDPLMVMVKEINERAKILTKDTVWPRRPLEITAKAN